MTSKIERPQKVTRCCARNCPLKKNLYTIVTNGIVSGEKYETVLCGYHANRLEKGKTVCVDYKWSPSK